MLFIDIVEFKFINSSFGYEEGDRVLKKVSSALEGLLEGPRETFARITADHFVLLLSYEKFKSIDTMIRLLFSELEHRTSKGENGYSMIFNGGLILSRTAGYL